MSEPIKREDIKAGDRYRRICEYTASVDLIQDVDENTTYELIERPVPLPTVPGYYLDRNGVLWNLKDGNWMLRHTVEPAAHVVRFAPFVMLRPVAEVAAEVLADVETECADSFDSDSMMLHKLRAKWVTK